MMMMFGDKKKAVGAIVNGEVQKPEEINAEEVAMETAMQKLILAVQHGDAKKASEAFKSAFQLCELAPHEEYDND